jgi:hypothetical protein
VAFAVLLDRLLLDDDTVRSFDAQRFAGLQLE